MQAFAWSESEVNSRLHVFMVRAFSELDFYYVDPVFHYANRSLTPFFWDAEEFRAELTAPQMEIMEEARRFGIERGACAVEFAGA